ncbi:MAG: DUF2341 domain-containing protein [Cytophagaceae bacterium]
MKPARSKTSAVKITKTCGNFPALKKQSFTEKSINQHIPYILFTLINLLPSFCIAQTIYCAKEDTLILLHNQAEARSKGSPSPDQISFPDETVFGPQVSGSIVNAYCHGSSDGRILYTISGSSSPYTYGWSNGKGGRAYGSYYRIVTINNPNPTLTDYQVRIELGKTPEMKADYSDLRFSDTSCTTLYSCWLQPPLSSTACVFWVKIPVIPSGISHMKISYGDPAAVPVSNGANTFVLFDDFNDGDFSDWTAECFNINEAGEKCTATINSEANGYSVRLSATASCNATTTNGAMSEIRKTFTIPGGQYRMDLTNRLYTCLIGNCQDSTRFRSQAMYGTSFIINYWYLPRRGTCGCSMSTLFNPSSSIVTSNGSPTVIRLQGVANNCGEGYLLVDNFRIRKAVSVDPSISIGPQQQLALDGLVAGTYTITVTDANGTNSSETFEISQPTLPVAENKSICRPGQITLSTQGGYADYRWYDSEAASPDINQGATFTTNISNPSVFYITGIGTNGCESSPKVEVRAGIDEYSAGFIGTSHVILPGQKMDTIKVLSKTGEVLSWKKTLYPYNNESVSNLTSNTFFEPIHTTTIYSAEIQSGVCPPVSSNRIKVTVNKPHQVWPDTIFVTGTTYQSYINLLSNDKDPEDDFLSIRQPHEVKSFSGGDVSFTSHGNVTYKASNDFTGIDSVIYYVCDFHPEQVRHCIPVKLIIVVDNPKTTLKIYPAISPNGDNLNDTWIIDGIENYPSNTVRIFDRSGTVLFEQTDYDNSNAKVWKGQSNYGSGSNGSEIPDGTYYYQVDLGNGEKPRTGFVVLKR